MNPSKFFPTEHIGVSFSGFHGIPYTYVLPSVATAAYNAMSYGPPNGTGGKFQNAKVHPYTLRYYLI